MRTLVLLALAGCEGLAGCGGAQKPICHPATGEALTLACEACIEHAETDAQADAIAEGCHAMVDVRGSLCRRR